MAMASGASVTVSIAADTIGMLERDLRREARGRAHLAGQDVGLGRQEQDVVEREPFLGELRRVAVVTGSTAARRAFVAGEGAGRGLHGGSLVASSSTVEPPSLRRDAGSAASTGHRRVPPARPRRWSSGWPATSRRRGRSRCRARSPRGGCAPSCPRSPAGAPEAFDDVLADLDRSSCPGITHWQHPGWHAYFPTGASGPSVLADLVSSGLGVQGMLWSTSPACTELETHVLDWMAELLGLPERFRSAGAGGGVIEELGVRGDAVRAPGRPLAGGRATGRSTTCAPTRRRRRTARSRRRCASRGSGPTSSGWSRSTTRSRCGPTRSRAAMAEDRAAGLAPFFVVANVGTTSSTAHRPARARSPTLCAEHGAWLHVDAAHAGSALVCPELRWIVDGARAGRQLLHEPAQVAVHQLRLRLLLGGRPGGARRRAHRACPSTCATRPASRVRSSTTATGRCRSAAGSGPSSCGSCCAPTAPRACATTSGSTSTLAQGLAAPTRTTHPRLEVVGTPPAQPRVLPARRRRRRHRGAARRRSTPPVGCSSPTPGSTTAS